MKTPKNFQVNYNFEATLTIVKNNPMTHIRIVFTGTEASSSGRTTARTSGKGESSAS